MVRKSTIHRNPIGSTSEALQRQRSRQSLRRQIMDISSDGLTMNTETLLEFNPKLAEVSHTTRIAYAKFMTTKLKKEIKFENDKIQIENEKVRAREHKAFNKFKANAGILKKTVTQASEQSNNVENHVEPDASTAASTANKENPQDFRARTPIEEDPNEDSQTPDRSSTPDSILDDSGPSQTSLPIPASSPTPSQNNSKSSTENRKPDSPIVKMKSASSSEKSVKSPEPQNNQSPPLLKTEEAEEDDDEDDEEEESVKSTSKPSSQNLSVPTTSSRPVSPSIINTSDKGKSKITGKTLTGWI